MSSPTRHFGGRQRERQIWSRGNVVGTRDWICPLLMLWTALHQAASLWEANKMEESHGVCGDNRIPDGRTPAFDSERKSLAGRAARIGLNKYVKDGNVLPTITQPEQPRFVPSHTVRRSAAVSPDHQPVRCAVAFQSLLPKVCRARLVAGIMDFGIRCSLIKWHAVVIASYSGGVKLSH
jgi:hypothetical protein